MKLAVLISLSAVVILIENLILDRFSGCMHFPRLTRGRRAFIRTGLMLAALLLPVTALTWGVGRLLPENIMPVGRAAVFVLILGAVTAGLLLLLRKDTMRKRISGYRLEVCAANCVPVGLWQLLAVDAACTAGLVGTLLGVTVAAVALAATGIVLDSLSQRLRLSDSPACLRGLPMEILTAALLVMAAWGLRGM